MSQQVKTTLDFVGEGKIINLPDPSANQDAATKAYVDSAIEGLSDKGSARAASVSNLNIASPGATIDGITMALSDRVLLKDQTTASQNGIYIWNGSTSAMTRSLDANTARELEQAVISIEEGTNANTTWRQTSVNFTLGTGSVSWIAFGTSVPNATESTPGIAAIATQTETDAGAIDNKFITPLKLKTSALLAKMGSTLIGDGSATQYDITHNFGTRKVTVCVRRNASPWDQVLVDNECPDTNTVRVRFNVAPASNAYQVTILAQP